MDIAVAAFYLLNEAALGVVGVTHERPITDVIGKGGKEKLSKPQHYPKNTVFYSVNHSVIG